MFIKFLSDAEKQLATEKESLENLRKQIGEAQKQSGKRKFEFARTGNPKLVDGTNPNLCNKNLWELKTIQTHHGGIVNS